MGIEISYDEEGQTYAADAKVATVVWLEYDGEDPELEDHYLLMDRDKELGRGLAALGGKVEQKDFGSVDVDDGSDSYRDIYLSEAAKNNAEREAREEAQVDSVYDMEQLGRVVQISREQGSFDEPWIIYHFRARTDEEPESYEHREGDLRWHHRDQLDDQEYTLMHGEFVENVQEDQPFTATIDDAHGTYHSFSPDQTPISKVDGLREWPERLLEQNLAELPPDLVDQLYDGSDQDVLDSDRDH